MRRTESRPSSRPAGGPSGRLRANPSRRPLRLARRAVTTVVTVVAALIGTVLALGVAPASAHVEPYHPEGAATGASSVRPAVDAGVAAAGQGSPWAAVVLGVLLVAVVAAGTALTWRRGRHAAVAAAPGL